MLQSRLAPLAVMIFYSVSQPLAAASTEAELESEARALVTQFVGSLKPRLKQALQQGGPSSAIAVCASEAPTIADALSRESGWEVSRVSLRTRNIERATPDAWETAVLESFEQRQGAGEAAASLQFSELSGGRYRYMQAQGVDAVCLLCHGEDIAPAVRETLQRYYPQDTATGYQLGQVRGAISLSRTP